MRFGVVAIGRNEGERLRRCLESVCGCGMPVVYVDSGSSDGSVDVALSLGAELVELDLSTPFTAARARNAGRERLRELDPTLEAAQFIDGDCELDPAWLDTAAKALGERADLAVAWGRRRERAPESSIYNRLCDLEWDTPVGDSTWFGGDALIRLDAFDAVGGYDPAVIAGEEPDLAWRLRSAGWHIERLDAEMTLHDAAITRFAQWWRRAERAGHAHIDMAARHGFGVEPYAPKGVVKTLVWSIILPLVVSVAAVVWSPWTLLALGLYDLLFLKITIGAHRSGRSWSNAITLGIFTVLAKWPETLGYLRWAARRISGRRATIIEYKRPSPTPGRGPSAPTPSDAT